MSDCANCGHDRLLHHQLEGPCLIMTATHPYRLCIGCGCGQYMKAPAKQRRR